MYAAFWSLLTQQARTVRDLHHKFKDELAYVRDLPETYKTALQALDQTQTTFQSFILRRITHEYAGWSLPRLKPADKASGKLFRENRVEWAPKILVRRDSSRIVFGFMLPELDQYLQENPDQANQMSALVRQVLDAMSTCQRLWPVLGCHTPMLPTIAASSDRSTEHSDPLYHMKSVLGPEPAQWIDDQWRLFDERFPMELKYAPLLQLSAFAPRKGRKDLKWLEHEDKRRSTLDGARNDHL
jgi:hypothetical protein